MKKRTIDDLPAIETFKLHVILMQMRAILRPSAMKQLQRYVLNLDDAKKIDEFFRWGSSVCEADNKEKFFLIRKETKRRVNSAPFGIFRKPKSAFKVRWMYRPRNIRAYIRAYKEGHPYKRP